MHVITGAQSYDLIEAAKPEPMKKQLGLHMIRRSNEGGHHYFIANLTPNDVEQSVKLAVDFEDALWYDPMTGKSYAVEFDNGKVKIALRSGESMILQTFKHEQQLRLKKKPYVSQAKPVQRMVLYRGWKLSFENSEPAIKKTYSLDTLRTWEKLDSKTRTLMGTGVYQCSFDLKKKMLNGSRTWQIELGDVRECAHVNINGHDIGCAWAVPFVLTFDASILKLKKNIIRVSVNNLPANRIAEMDRKGIEWRKMKDLNVVDINYQHTNYANWEPMPSGLNSRVRLVRVE